MPEIAPITLAERARRLVDDAVTLADAWRIAGRWADALILLGGLEPIAQEYGGALRAAQALATARVLTEQDGFGDADTLAMRTIYLDTALAVAQQIDDPVLLGAIWDARGMSLHYAYLDGGRTAEPPEELPSFERGLGYRQQAADQRGIAESLFHVGLVYGVVRQDHAQALPFFRQSYDLAQALGDRIMASYAIRHIAFVQHDAGDMASARASLQESLELREQAGFIPAVAMALVMLAHADADLGQHDQAIQHLRRAQTIFLGLGAERKATWLEQLIAEFQQR
jgi:tetratricopeptide (TPR) repeat protein